MKNRGTRYKFDGEKLMWDLLPVKPIEEVVDILTFGAKKYNPESWRKVEDPINRYYAALMRHIIAYRNGEKIDPESGRTHLAHAICNLIFLSEFENKTLDKSLKQD